jgi:hypothetical protein
MKYLLPAIIVFFSLSVHAATYTVNSNSDSHDVNRNDNVCADATNKCTLRAAVEQSNETDEPDTITFSPTTPTTINLTIGALDINRGNITILGLGARNLTVQRSTANGTPKFGIFHIGGTDIIVSISGITFANGDAQAGGGAFSIASENTVNLTEIVVKNNTAGNGAGIQNFGVINITRSTFNNNIARPGYGGAIANYGIANISNSTFSNNTSDTGGALYQSSISDPRDPQSTSRDPQLTLNNVTVSYNNAFLYGGGISIEMGAAKMKNTIVAQNSISVVGFEAYSDISGGIYNTLGNNLIGAVGSWCNAYFFNGVNDDKVGTPFTPIDPLLGNLQNNGGQTDTHALLPGSPAIDKGNNSNSLGATDQCGFARIVNGIIDIGAAESQSVTTNCNYALTPNMQNITASGGFYSFTITTTPSCSFTSIINHDFIAIDLNASGTGTKTITYFVRTNSGAARTGTITIGDQTFTVNQDGVKSRKRTRFINN